MSENNNEFRSSKEKYRHGWVGTVIHWEVCKRLGFDHINQWYIYKPENILKIKGKIPWDCKQGLNILYTEFCCCA